MTSVEELIRRLTALVEESEGLRAQLEYEVGEACSTRDRVQSSFGDQRAGHHAAMLLDTASGQLLEAQGYVVSLQAELRALMAKLRS